MSMDVQVYNSKVFVNYCHECKDIWPSSDLAVINLCCQMDTAGIFENQGIVSHQLVRGTLLGVIKSHNLESRVT